MFGNSAKEFSMKQNRDRLRCLVFFQTVGVESECQEDSFNLLMFLNQARHHALKHFTLSSHNIVRSDSV